jgi:hypothetical protein
MINCICLSDAPVYLTEDEMGILHIADVGRGWHGVHVIEELSIDVGSAGENNFRWGISGRRVSTGVDVQLDDR